MKKISTFLLALVVMFFGTFLSACGEGDQKDIKLSASSVTIYIGETEGNTEIINAKPENISVNSLSIFYDNTNITITQSSKKADGSFDLFISSNGEQGCESVEVIVRAGAEVQKSFFVNVVVPVADITAEANIVVPFSGQEVKYNLYSKLSFIPETTKQKNVAFEILTENLEGKATIDGNYLVLSSDYDVFGEAIRIVVQSMDKSELRKEFNVNVVPNTKYYARDIQMFKLEGGSEIAISSDGYVVNIENNELSSPLEFVVRIPKALGIAVDIAATYEEQLNISQYLTYKRTAEEVNLGQIYIEYIFTFESLNLKTGRGNLYFSFYYINGDATGELSSVFAVAESSVIDFIPLEILIPMKGIDIKTSCETAAGGAYIIYQNYNLNAIYGSQFLINAIPVNATERIFIVKNLTNVKVYKWSSANSKYIEVVEGEQIEAGTSLYVCGNIAGTASFVIEKYQEGVATPITKTINLAVSSGATALGFVETVGSVDAVTRKEIAVECDNVDGTSVILYASGTVLSDLIYDASLKIQPWNGNPNCGYYEINVVADEAGVTEYVISTANGYEVTLIANAIQTVSAVKVTLKNQTQDVSGVHNIVNTDGSITKIALEHGYTAGLIFEIDKDAEIAQIKYTFVDALLGEGAYVSAYSADYINFDSAAAINFINYSSVINTQNIKESNLITAINEGKVVVKIEIIGYVVENGQIKESSTPIEKFICVEVYRPIVDIVSTSKTIELRAKNQLAESDYTYATAEVDLSVLANGGKFATYGNIFIDGGYVDGEYVNDSVDVVIDGDDRIKYSVSLNRETNKLTILVDSVPNNYNFGVQNIVLFVADFYLLDGCSLNTVKQNYSVITYTIYLNIVQTSSISDINVTSLKLAKTPEYVEEIIDGSAVNVLTKTYEEIYLDVSKSATGTNIYKIVTEVLPINAFNKQLKYSFVPEANNSAGLVDVSSNDGTIYYSDAEGGRGKIVITPNDSKNKTIKVVIPITIADGSEEAPFQITSLTEIKNPNKHYVITTLSTLELTSPLFNGEAFKGGLYGKLSGASQNATIKLNGCSLFDIISNEAKVKNLTLYGDATASGFIANENKGLIENVVVTTYVLNGVYVPSLLTARATDQVVGGLVGANLGEIISCEFAGSIKKSASTITVGGISGQNTGTETNCEIDVAKFEYASQNVGRVIYDGENYFNGILESSGTVSGTVFTGGNVNTGSSLTGDEYVKNIPLIQGGYKSLGKSGLKNGIVFYFEAKDSSKQVQLNLYNTIAISEIISSDCSEIKVLAQNVDGTNCSFVSVSGDNIVISGVGEFVLKVYSAHDYTTYQTINMLSINYFSNFGLYNDGKPIENGEIFNILKGGRDVVVSKTTAIIDDIELKQGTLSVIFTLDGQDGANYITGSTLGSHTINALWENESAALKITLSTGYALAYDTLINAALTPNGNYIINLSMKLGTTKIETSANDGGVEPKDPITFNAYITTDIIDDNGNGNFTTSDRILPETIEIKNTNGTICTSDFEIYVGGGIYQPATGKFSYEISIFLKEAKRHEKAYVNQNYIVKIQAQSGADVYDAYATFNLTILPQSLSDVAVALYNITSNDGQVSNVSKTETPTSVLGQSDSGILIVDLFPNYATFDYIEIIATSNTMAKLAFRVQKQFEGKANRFEYDDDAEFESISGVNGIRIKNNFAGETLNQDIGTYYILIFATNTLNQDVVFDVAVNVWYNGVKLDEYTNFTLYVKMPESPEVSIDGQDSVYAYPGETLIANVKFPDDQILTSTSVIDVNGTQLDINVFSSQIETSNGYNQYKLQLTIPKDMGITTINSHLRLVVRSLKLNKGNQEPAEDELQIYVVNFKIKEGSIGIKDANDGIFNISSIKYSDIELYTNFLYSLNEEGINEAVDFFNENYYFDNDAGFSVGSNLELSKAQILSTYLYYVKDNVFTPVYTIDEDGKIKKSPNNWYGNYIDFNIKDAVYDSEGKLLSDYKLQVKGGESTGEIPMLLQIYYSMPDGSTYVYDYTFKFVNSLYTTEDMPIEIVDSTSFVGIPEEETAYDYILANDIYLYDYEVMQDTSKIKSLDGNNYTIHIMSFKSPSQTSASFALFNTISAETTIKNLSVNYYYLNDIEVIDEVTDIKFAGLAINNNGVVANCEIISFAAKEKTPTFTTYGIKLTISDKSTANVNVAGFVLNNIGSITNSRVGGDSKLVTKYDYTDDSNPTLIETYAPITTFTIRASGTISGFVYSNTGVISSSFAKNISIINKYNKNQTKITSGFVNSNEGTIAMSYAEGVKDGDEIQASAGGIEATGIMAGFVYSNISTITDSYSNIMLHTSNNQVGRLGAGFVYYNAPTATIQSSYSFSSISGNNTTQLNFAGITDLMEYNNLGTIKNCYFYITDEMEAISIESMFNTEINTVTNVGDQLNFYGFSFASQYAQNLSATWKSTPYGPQLVGANDIAHSVRYKVDNPKAGDSSLEYIYVYEDKYDLGTAKNPIIIRSAQEFNGVLGGYNSSNTEIEENYNLNTKKIFGSYRLVNHIDLNELIIEEKEDTDYKYDLSSTKMILSGEMTETSNRMGAFNGNGLTIANLAIANSTSGSDNFGMFKSIEKGANVSNVNIVLAKGGINADNTKNVGTIAGTLSNSALVNVKITTNSEEDHTDVIGSNIVGGAVGRVIENSYVFGVEVSGISVIATYNQANSLGEYYERSENYVYNRSADNFDRLSIAGGAFGVIDIYTKQQIESEENRNADEILFANVQAVKVAGGMTISATTASGVIGFVGNYVVAKDLLLEITKTEKQAKIIAYSNGIAGGVVGYNMGYLYQIRAEHEKLWQDQIELNIGEYYRAVDQDTRNNIDRGNINLFQTEEDDVTYKPSVIGGLVGYLENGVINVSYSKINVRNKYASIAGGIIGYIKQNATSGASSEYVAELSQVYATGDVYAGGEGRTEAFTGGIIGYNKKENLTLDKVNALNIWSIETSEGVRAAAKCTIAQLATLTSNCIISVQDVSLFKYTDNSIKFGTNEFYKVSPFKADGGKVYEIDSAEQQLIEPYYNYYGAYVDNGALVDIAFTNFEWYETGNWSRDVNEVYPHIRFVVPTTIYDIYDKNDFRLFGLYGYNPEAKFIIRSEEPIDCKGWTKTYPLIKGSITGMYPESGFWNLSVPLFAKASSASISNLVFKECSAPIVKTAEGVTKFSYLSYFSCKFTPNIKDAGGSKINNYAGVAYEISPYSITFRSISFTDCEFQNGNYVKAVKGNTSNVGLLFATTIANASSSGTIDIGGITVKSNESPIEITTEKGSNIGLLFGKSEVKTSIQNVSIASKLSVTVSACQDEVAVASATTYNSKIGLLAGYAKDTEMKNISIESQSSIEVVGVDAYGTESIENTEIISVGGLVGASNKLILSSEENTKNTNYYANNIRVFGTQEASYVGGIVGQILDGEGFVNKMSGNNNIFVGSIESTYSTIEVALAKDTICVGGLIGAASVFNSELSGNNIVYNGDIIIDQDATKDSANYAYVGGVIGQLGEENKQKISKLKNIVFSGTINFKNKIQSPTYYIGGIIGGVAEKHTANLTEVYSIGDISLNGKAGDIMSNETGFVGGIIGQVKDNARSTLSGVVSLATIYNKHQYEGTNAVINWENIDPIANVNTSDSISAEEKGASYASNVTLCTTRLKVNNIKNANYGKIVGISGSATELDGLAQIPTNIKAMFRQHTTKLSPINYTNNSSNSDKYKDICPIDDSVINERTYSGTNEYRKAYIYLSNAEPLIPERRISLKNAFMFSDGGVMYTTKTPFDRIDEYSAVSGIVSKVKITDANYGTAGFATINSGIIYTCSAQEPFVYFEDLQSPLIRTNLFGYISASKEGNYAGFVVNNMGYIFGSSSNMQIESSIKVNIGGFAYVNSGTIEYSYSSGYVNLVDGGAIDELDVFAHNESANSYVEKESCYSIFSNLTGAEISNSFEVVANNDEIESQNDKIKAYSLYGNANFNDLMGSNVYYNNNYPVLKYGEFEGSDFDYVRRGNFVYKHSIAVVESGLEEIVVYFNDNQEDAADDDKNGEKDKYFIIPNIVAFKAIENNTNYVLARDLNVGYNGIENTAAFIGEYSGGILNGYNFSIKNSNFSGANVITTLGNNAKIENLTIESLTLTNSSGFIGENNGIIRNIDLSGDINVSVSETGTDTRSVLVGKNYGHIILVQATASVELSGALDEYCFGIIAGESTDTSKLESVTLHTAKLNIVENKNINIYIGGIVGLLSGGTITGCGITNDKTEIFAASNGITYLGGLVGKTTGNATIEKCYVGMYSSDSDGALITITAGSEERSDEDLNESNVGFMSESSYVGGILGYVLSGEPSIHDCSVYADITARAQWIAEGSKEAYKYDVATNEILLYRLMKSEAYAGGICSNYIEDKNTVSSISGSSDKVYRVASFGEVSGGFKAWKPIAALSANNNGSWDRMVTDAMGIGVGVGLGITAIAKRTAIATGAKFLASSAVKTATKIGANKIAAHLGGKLLIKGVTGAAKYAVPIAGWVLAAIEIGWQIYQIYQYIEDRQLAEEISLKVTLINGNSNSTVSVNVVESESDNSEVSGNVGTNVFGNKGVSNDSSNTVINGTKIEDIIIKHQTKDKGKNWLGVDKEPDYRTLFTGNTQYDMSGKVINIKRITAATESDETYNYGTIGGEYLYYDDALIYNTSDSIGESNVLDEIYYDSIAPTLSGGSKNVYGDTSNYIIGEDSKEGETFDAVNLKTANNSNATLRFKYCEDMDSVLQKYSNAATSTRDWHDIEPSIWNKDGQLIVSVPKTMRYSEKMVDGKSMRVFTITDAKTWLHLVHTINSGSELDSDGNTIIGGTNPYLDTDILIEIAEGVNNIKVGSNILKEFNGTIDVKGNTNFTDLSLFVQNGTESIGLIASSHSAILKNVSVAGDVNIEYRQTPDVAVKPVNIGMLVGTVCSGGTGVALVDCSLVQQETDEIVLLGNVENKIDSIGGLIGAVEGPVKITGANVDIGSLRLNTTYLAAENAYSGFGGVIGKILENSVQISTSNINISDLSLISGINMAGGIVGYNAGTFELRGGNSVNVKNLMLVSATTSAYAGGVLGYNGGTITINDTLSINTGLQEQSIISADVLDGKYSAYAGGVLGYNLGTKNLNANVIIGTQNSHEGYNGLFYLYAGANAYAITNGMCAIPSSAGVGKIVGNDNNDNIVVENVYGVYEKAISINNSFDSTYMDNINTAVIADDDYIAILEDLGYSVEIDGNESKIYFDNSDSETDTPTKESMSYIVKSGNRYNSADASNSKVYEWFISYNVEKHTTSLVSSDLVDGELTNQEYETENMSITMDYLIRITEYNRFANDSNKYMLQVILLNASNLENLNTDEETIEIEVEGYNPEDESQEPLVVYSYIFDAKENIKIDINIDLDNDLSTDMTTLNSSAFVGAYKTITETETKTENYTVIFSDNMYFEIINGEISLKENLKKQQVVSTFKKDGEGNWSFNNKTASEITDVTTRTIFSEEIGTDDSYTLETSSASSVISGLDESTFMIDAETLINGKFNDVVVYNGYVIPYSNLDFNFNKCVSTNWYKGKINNQNIEILSVISGSGVYNPASDSYAAYEVNEFVFKNENGATPKLYYLGNISYTLTNEAYTYINLASRYQNYMPVFPVKNTSTDKDLPDSAIFNIVYDISAEEKDSFVIEGFSSVSSVRLNSSHQLEKTIYLYSLKLENGQLSFVKGDYSATVAQPAELKLDLLAGTHEDVVGGCDSYYVYAGKVVGYIKGTEYFYYNFYNGEYSAVSNGTNSLNFYSFS